MRTIITIILAIAILIAIAACTSQSERLADRRLKQAHFKKQVEINQGIDAIIVQHANATFKVLNDTVALRVEDNVFFVKRRAKDINMGYWRYYRVY